MWVARCEVRVLLSWFFLTDAFLVGGITSLIGLVTGLLASFSARTPALASHGLSAADFSLFRHSCLLPSKRRWYSQGTTFSLQWALMLRDAMSICRLFLPREEWFFSSCCSDTALLPLSFISSIQNDLRHKGQSFGSVQEEQHVYENTRLGCFSRKRFHKLKLQGFLWSIHLEIVWAREGLNLVLSFSHFTMQDC